MKPLFLSSNCFFLWVHSLVMFDDVTLFIIELRLLGILRRINFLHVRRFHAIFWKKIVKFSGYSSKKQSIWYVRENVELKTSFVT